MRPSDFILCAIELARHVNMAKNSDDGNFQNEHLALEKHFGSNDSAFTYFCLAIMYIGRGEAPEWENLVSVFTCAEAVDRGEAVRQMTENTRLPSQLIDGIMACVKRDVDINEEFKRRWGEQTWEVPQ